MTERIEDIFAGGFEVPFEAAPVKVLKDVAEKFAAAVRFRLNMDVRSTFSDAAQAVFPGVSGTSGGSFLHVVLLEAPKLSYSSEFLRVTHGIKLYPAKVHGGLVPTPVKVSNEKELIAALAEVFRLPTVQEVIGSLLSQL